MKNDFKWAFAGGKPQGIAVLAALVEAGFVPSVVSASVPDELAVLKALCPSALVADSGQWDDLDLILTCRYELLKSAVFEKARWGAVNLHSSLLPAYRGVHPVSWALIAGETETGVTIHRIDSGVDTGNILAQKAIGIEAGDDLWSLTRRLDALSAEMAVSFFRGLDGGLPEGVPQTGTSTYAPRRLPEDGAFSFKWPARKIRDLIRALPPPMPSAFADTEKGRFKASRCEILREGEAPKATPGTILGQDQGFAFATADGIVRLEGEWC